MGTGDLQVKLPISKIVLTKHAKGSWTADVYDANDEFVISHHLEKKDVDLLERGEQVESKKEVKETRVYGQTRP